jgi:putative transposase
MEGLQMKKRFTEEQIVRMLRDAEVSGMPIRDFCRKQNLTEQTFFRWRNKYGGMDVPDARRLKELEGENAKLKRLVAEQLLVIDGLREFAGKK